MFAAEEAGSEQRRLVKVYRRGYGVKADALAKVQSIEDARVARLFEFGQLADACWFEVQEFVDAEDLGALRRSYGDKMLSRMLLEVIRELDRAVTAFHAAGLAHHDIKPENVLVRSRRPVSLVLIDFGLAVSSWDNDSPLSNRHGTINYQPPEAMAQQGGFGRDRWSMGMTVAMVATGQVPYQAMAPYDILQALYRQEPPPLIGQIRDGRIRNLCSGLTRHDLTKRWGDGEVAAWLAGENPVVPEERPRPGAAVPSVRFDGHEFTDPAALAASILANPAAAENQLKAAARRQTLLDQLLAVLGGPALNELDQRWSVEAPQTQQAIAELAVALDPAAPPTLRGRSISPAELALLAHEATGGDTEAGKIVSILAAAPVLAAWGRGTTCPEYADAQHRWRQALDTYQKADQAATAAGAQHADDAVARAQILAAVIDPDYATTLADQRTRTAPRHTTGQDWYQNLIHSTGPGAVVTAIVHATEANRLATEHRARTAEQARGQRRQRWENRRQQWARNRVTRLCRIQSIALVALVGAAYIEYDRGALVGWLAQGAFDTVGVSVGDFLILRPDWLALVLGTAATLMLSIEAGGPRMRYELAALLGAVGGILYTGGAIGPATATQGTAVLAAVLYAGATVACGWSAAEAWNGRTGRERDRSDDRRWLRNADRTVLVRTLTATLTLVVPGLIGLAWIWHNLDGRPLEGSLNHLWMASWGNVVLAAVTRGLWIPLAVGTFLLLLRGNWNRRPYGMRVTAALAAATMVAYFAGAEQSGHALERTREAFVTTPISEDAVEGGFCGSVWTGTQTPSRTATSGPKCREIHRYDGWHLSWTYRPPSPPDDLSSIDGMYLVLWKNEQELTALDGRTGEVAWERSCSESRFQIDDNQLDQGEDTPANQRVIGRCGENDFDVDPRTGD